MQPKTTTGAITLVDSYRTRQLITSSTSVDTHVLRLLPFGPGRDLELDGVRLGIGRLKVIEFVALMSLNPTGIARSEISRQLFPESEARQAGNYFRQVMHKFRELTGITVIRRHGNMVALPTCIQLASADAQVEDASLRATYSQDAATQLYRMLDEVHGRYMEDSVLPWAEQRRNRMDVVEEEARLGLARVLIGDGAHAPAREQCERVLERNRYSDSAYRLLVAIERSAGSEVSCMAVYRRAATALREIGLRPGDARRLFHNGSLGGERPSNRQLSDLRARAQGM